jgi:hypothetical protein
MRELLIPEAGMRDADSVEMARVWIAEQQLHCSIKVGMYQDTMNISEGFAWGVILADIARHVAAAMVTSYSADEASTIREIEASFLDELAKATSDASGEFVQRH